MSSQNLNVRNENQNQTSTVNEQVSTTQEVDDEILRNTTLPSIPQRAFSHIRTISSISSPTLATSECLPPYSLVINDMPPTYPMDQLPSPTGPPSYDSTGDFIEPLIHLEAPIHRQDYWPITKKLYISGFIIWPLWLIGAIFILFGHEYKCKQGNEEDGNNDNDSNNKVNTGRLKWAIRCLYNSIIFISVLIYVAIALNKSKGKLY